MKIATVAMGVGLSTFLMTGCGGTDPQNDPHAATLSGVAVDDLILDGKVSATKPDGSALAEGRTSKTDGSYQLKVSYEGAVVVSVTCDGDSQMLDPETNTTTECTGVDGLKSIATAAKDTAVTVNITPLTHIAYERAKALGEINASTIKTANAQIKSYFGIDPLAGDPTKGDYAKIAKAFGKAAHDNNVTFMEIVKGVAEDLKDGSADGSNATKRLVAAMRDKGITGVLVATGGTYTPPPATGDNGKSDLENAKALVNHLLAAYSVKGDPKGKVVDFAINEAKKIPSDFNSDNDLKALSSHHLRNMIEYTGKMYAEMLINGDSEAEKEVYAGQRSNAPGEVENLYRTVTISKKGDTAHYTISGVDTKDTKFSGDITLSVTGDIEIKDDMSNFFKDGKVTLALDGTLPVNSDDSSTAVITIKNLKVVLDASTEDNDHMLVLAELSGKVSTGADELNIGKITGRIAYHKDKNDNPAPDYIKLEQAKGTAKAAGLDFALNAKTGDYQQVKALKGKELPSGTYFSGLPANSGWLPTTLFVDGSVTDKNGTYLKATDSASLGDIADLDLYKFESMNEFDKGKLLGKLKAIIKSTIALKLPGETTPIVLSGKANNISTDKILGALGTFTYSDSDVNMDINATVTAKEYTKDEYHGYHIAIDTNSTDINRISMFGHVDEGEIDEKPDHLAVIKGKDGKKLGTVTGTYSGTGSCSVTTGACSETRVLSHLSAKFTDGSEIELK